MILMAERIPGSLLPTTVGHIYQVKNERSLFGDEWIIINVHSV